MRAALFALLICLLGAGLEGLFAGGAIKQRLSTLRQPSHAIPFWGWIIIGMIYYAICFGILYRLFLLPIAAPRTVALVFIGAIMFVNALWNYFFFRSGNLFHAYLLGVAYTGLALLLFWLLIRLDRPSAWCFVPYTAYLFYANYWGYRIWKLNADRRDASTAPPN
jgi:tryptophan-rich sensory protein